ncbi:MAG: hypothetical protein KDB10_10665 [Acidimicrobiales bacterium]|nr:hypothetical protein [Acidimicrobiales bacterium]
MLEPNGRVTVAEAAAVGAVGLGMAVVALIGWFFVVRAVVHLLRAAMGTVVWKG